MIISGIRKQNEHFDPKVLERYPPLRSVFMQTGNTPLIAVESPQGHGRIYAKCEWHNPNGSIKDRVALAMVWSALSLDLMPPAALLEYSGGQLAVALSRICQLLGIKLLTVLSDATPSSLIAAVKSYGADVELTPKCYGFWGTMERAFAISAANPHMKFLYQHTNEANLYMHRTSTAEEIIEQLPESRVDAWIASIGTGGTLMGVFSRLQEHYPYVRAYAVTPSEMPYATEKPPNTQPKLAGSGGLGNGRKQPFVAEFESSLAGHFYCSYPQATAAMLDYYNTTGTRIGSSAAANLIAARKVARDLGENAVVVTVFPSAGVDEEWQAIISNESL